MAKIVRSNTHDHRTTAELKKSVTALAREARGFGDGMAAPHLKKLGDDLHDVINAELGELQHRNANGDRCGCCGAVPGTPVR